MSNIIKAFIVMEQSLEYNDQTYSMAGAEPKKAFINREEALVECKILNIKALKEWSNIEDIDIHDKNKDGHLYEKIRKYGGTVESKYKVEYATEFDMSGLTDEQADDILESLDFEFFYVQAVELE